MEALYLGPPHGPSAGTGTGSHRRRRLGSILLTALLGLGPGAFGIPPASSATGADVARAASLIVEGAGEGHGVGMSQDGAYGYAQHGASYQEILAHYYTGTAIAQAPAKSVVKVLIGSRVRRIPLERYVRGVIGAEMSPSWPLAALEAQAVASRTYALTDHAGGSRFDVYADTRSQVFRGAAAETSATRAAVGATAGQILTYEGKPAITYFFASSGGMTENVENGFPGAAPEPWLLGVPDAYDTGPTFAWKTTLTMAAAARSLRGLFKGSFRGIEVLQRGVSPRIVSARVLGSTGSSVLDGPELAGQLGLSSTWAYFNILTAKGIKHEPDRSAHARTPTPTVGAQGGVSATAGSASTSATGGAPAP